MRGRRRIGLVMLSYRRASKFVVYVAEVDETMASGQS